MRLRRVIPVLLAGLILVGLPGLDAAFPPDLSRAARLSTELRDTRGRIVHAAVTSDGFWRLRPQPSAVAPLYRRLLLMREDRWFNWHPGVNPLAALRAVWQVARHGHVVSGGSTIAMQTVRLLHPGHAHARNWRGLPAKLLEMARAVQLQAHLGREGVLALYETLAPMGGNVEGVRTASLIWFGHEPGNLTPAEAALLAAIPQSPASRRPDRHPRVAGRGAERVLRLAGLPASAAPLVVVHALPNRAPHLAARFGRDAGPVETWLDGDLQEGVERIVSETLSRRSDPASDIAVLVLRNHDRAVLAYAGGGRYFGPSGMVDMVRAVRSPGSALKPFLYGMGFDQALVAPDTLIADSPLQSGTYAPRNADRRWHGDMTARRALQLSLNIPAVALLARLGPDRFQAVLNSAGAHLTLPRGASSAGLSLALGGAGIRMRDLAALYAGLATGGVPGSIRVRRADPPHDAAPLCTARTAATVLDILRGTPLPEGVGTPERPIAYKTGTSYGFRDAWAAGVSPRYTVVVWSGRRDGAPRPGAYGLTASAPVMFRVFDLLPQEAPLIADAPARPPRLGTGLRRLGEAVTDAGPHIVFPPNGAVLDGGEEQPVDLRARGGQPPYRWIVDGAVLPLPMAGLGAIWKPEGPGFHHVTVEDHNGRAASADIRLTAGEP